MRKRVDILIVDDDLDLRTVLRDTLRERGLTSAEAVDGQCALDWLESNPAPQLILLDIMMPRMGGLAFRSIQLTKARIKDIPVVIMSASVRLSEVDSRMSASGYIVKPFQLEDFIDEIEKHVHPG